MKKLLKLIAAFLLILTLVLWGLYALNSALFTEGDNLKKIDCSYYEDTTGQLNVSAINTLFLQGEFVETKTLAFNFGRSRSAFWVRIFSSDVAALKNYIAVYCPNVQNVLLYISTKDGYKIYASGWGNSAIRQDEGMTYPVFYLDQERRTDQAIYLRVQSDYSHIYTINFYNEQELCRARVINYCLSSFLFGILAATVIANLIIYLILKKKICLFFAQCVFLIGAHQGCTTGIYNVLFPKHSGNIMQFSIEIGLLYLISIIVFFMVLSEVKSQIGYITDVPLC